MTKSLNTRVLVGSALNDRFVSSHVFEAIKTFVSLPPAEFYVMDQEVVYAIPDHQIGRPGFFHTEYFMHSTFDFTETIPRSRRLIKAPVQLKALHRGIQEIAFDRITILTEENDTMPFTLIQDATYSDVELWTRIRQVLNVYHDRTWKWNFREILCYPHRDVDCNNPFLYFKDEPRYEIELICPGVCEADEILDFLLVALPDPYRKYDIRSPNRTVEADPATLRT